MYKTIEIPTMSEAKESIANQFAQAKESGVVGSAVSATKDVTKTAVGVTAGIVLADLVGSLFG